MEALESVLGSLSFLEPLRPDEIGRVARRFEVRDLAAGERFATGDSIEEARLVVLLAGRAQLEVALAAKTSRADLAPGDRHGELGLLTGHLRPAVLVATTACSLALLDRAGLDALLADFPAIAETLTAELASELAVRNDQVRQILELHAEGLAGAQLEEALEERRRAVAGRGVRVGRLTAGGLFRRLVVERGAEPPFWMLVGFFASLGGARLVVGLILKYGLEKRLFALVPGVDPNPMHIHHFNYGLILIGAAGLAALVPLGRRALRALSFVFGVGAGLVFDEFALFWNLNPEYAQRLSLVAAALMATLLVQLTYFRRFWAAVARTRWLALVGRR